MLIREKLVHTSKGPTDKKSAVVKVTAWSCTSGKPLLVPVINPFNDIYCYIDGLVQDCSSSTANVLEILQSCTKP